MNPISTPKEIPIVILCGGKSSRMGEDKSLLPFSSYPTLTQYQYERLKKEFPNIYLSSKVNKFDFLENDNNIIYDKSDIYSPLVALQTIFNFIQTNKVFILTVDTPFVKVESIKKLIIESQAYDITVAKTTRLHNLCGVFDKSILNNINQMINEDMHKVGFLLKKSNTNIIEFDNDDEFLNLNEMSDYKKAKSLL